MAELERNAFPYPMDAHRHEVIHEVIFARHGVEDRADQMGFFALGYLAEAKMGGFIRHQRPLSS